MAILIVQDRVLIRVMLSNRFQLDELKRAPYDIKWLFSATGHGKGAVDGVGGLIKHYATSHNLREPHEKSIQNADDFVEHVKKYTDAIKIIHLQDVEVEEFRKVKNIYKLKVDV